MKKILFILAIVGLVVTSCGNKKKKDTVGTHTHSDGTVHKNDAHDNGTDAKLNQETFEIKADDDADHKHSTDEHTHKDGTVHADHNDHK